MRRVVTSAILVPAITWVVLFAPHPAFAAVVCIFAALCWMEFAGIAAHYGAGSPPSPDGFPALLFSSSNAMNPCS